MSGKILLTASGIERFTKKLENLKNIERPQVIEDIALARSYGDLKENSEYTAAKEKQVLIEGSIAELENILSNYQVFDSSVVANKSEVRFGAFCEIENNGKITKFQLVSPFEADYDNGLLGTNSPFGKSLLGKKEGDIVEVQTGDGPQKFKICSVKYE